MTCPTLTGTSAWTLPCPLTLATNLRPTERSSRGTKLNSQILCFLCNKWIKNKVFVLFKSALKVHYRIDRRSGWRIRGWDSTGDAGIISGIRVFIAGIGSAGIRGLAWSALTARTALPLRALYATVAVRPTVPAAIPAAFAALPRAA